MSGVDKPIMDKAAELFGWAYGLGGFDVAVLEFVTFVRAQSDAQIAELEGALLAEQMHVEGLSTELAATKAQGVVMPDNLLSHRVTWRQALARLIELEDVADPETGRDDKAYWQHELRAFDAMYADLDRLNAAPVQRVSAPDACKACKGTGRRPIGGRGRIFGLTNRCFECQPLTDEEVYGQVTAHD